MNRVDKRQGFTLIELMLAMAFVSALLIAVAMTVIQIASIYNRGMTLKDVNQAGRSLSSELQRSISNSSVFNINSGVGSRYIVQDWGGRLCLGQYSYVWNYGEAIDINDTARLNVYSNSTEQIRFVKVLDPNTNYCVNSSTKVDVTNAIELLNIGKKDSEQAGVHTLALHDFKISTSATAGDTKTGQQLYSMEFLIGTNDQAALTFDSGTGNVICKAPSESGSDPAYCSVNQFNIVARAGNAVE